MKLRLSIWSGLAFALITCLSLGCSSGSSSSVKAEHDLGQFRDVSASWVNDLIKNFGEMGDKVKVLNNQAVGLAFSPPGTQSAVQAQGALIEEMTNQVESIVVMLTQVSLVLDDGIRIGHGERLSVPTETKRAPNGAMITGIGVVRDEMASLKTTATTTLKQSVPALAQQDIMARQQAMLGFQSAVSDMTTRITQIRTDLGTWLLATHNGEGGGEGGGHGDGDQQPASTRIVLDGLIFLGYQYWQALTLEQCLQESWDNESDQRAETYYNTTLAKNIQVSHASYISIQSQTPSAYSQMIVAFDVVLPPGGRISQPKQGSPINFSASGNQDMYSIINPFNKECDTRIASFRAIAGDKFLAGDCGIPNISGSGSSATISSTPRYWVIEGFNGQVPPPPANLNCPTQNQLNGKCWFAGDLVQAGCKELCAKSGFGIVDDATCNLSLDDCGTLTKQLGFWGPDRTISRSTSNRTYPRCHIQSPQQAGGGWPVFRDGGQCFKYPKPSENDHNTYFCACR